MKIRYNHMPYLELTKLCKLYREEVIKLDKIIKDTDKAVGRKTDTQTGNYNKALNEQV
jgi:hypothetical protein